MSGRPRSLTKRVRDVLRSPVERMPLLAESFRLVRDNVTFRRARPRPLPQGIRLMGDAHRTSGTYEPEETELIDGLLDTHDVFVDVGANIGYYTCLARARGKYVLAFEPSTTTLRFLYANLLANDMRDVEVLPVGVADKIDLAVFYGTGGSASLVEGWSRARFATVIPTTTLDRVLSGRFLDERLLIKIDIEGAEHACLLGARETIARRIAPTWFVEIYLDTTRRNENFKATFELFWSQGYTARLATRSGDVITPATVDGWIAGSPEPPGANFLFAR